MVHDGSRLVAQGLAVPVHLVLDGGEVFALHCLGQDASGPVVGGGGLERRTISYGQALNRLGLTSSKALTS